MKIAVVTACYNGEKFIHDCLLAVSKSVNFGEFEYEHVVVDDGSTDNSWQIINSFESSNLKKFQMPSNSGVSAAQNLAVSKTDADYLFFLGADDVILQNSLRFLAKKLSVKRDDWVYFDFISSDPNLAYTFGGDYYGWEFETVQSILFSMYTDNLYFSQNCVFKRSLLEKVGKYDETLRGAVDFDIYAKFLLEGVKPVYIPGILFIYRRHEKSITNTGKIDPDWHKKNVKKSYLKYQDKIKSKLTQDQISEIEQYINMGDDRT